MVADVRASAMMSLIGLDLPVAARVGATNLRALFLGEPGAVIRRLGRIKPEKPRRRRTRLGNCRRYGRRRNQCDKCRGAEKNP